MSCSVYKDDDNNTRSSAYIRQPRNLSPIQHHPKPCYCKLMMISFTYIMKSTGDRTRPCLTPPQSLNEPDNVIPPNACTALLYPFIITFKNCTGTFLRINLVYKQYKLLFWLTRLNYIIFEIYVTLHSVTLTAVLTLHFDLDITL